MTSHASAADRRAEVPVVWVAVGFPNANGYRKTANAGGCQGTQATTVAAMAVYLGIQT
jgi:hypothetical protein